LLAERTDEARGKRDNDVLTTPLMHAQAPISTTRYFNVQGNDTVSSLSKNFTIT